MYLPSRMTAAKGNSEWTISSTLISLLVLIAFPSSSKADSFSVCWVHGLTGNAWLCTPVWHDGPCPAYEWIQKIGILRLFHSTNIQISISFRAVNFNFWYFQGTQKPKLNRVYVPFLAALNTDFCLAILILHLSRSGVGISNFLHVFHVQQIVNKNVNKQASSNVLKM